MYSSEYFSVLYGFISEMHSWELKYFPLITEASSSDDLKIKESARNELLGIFDKYLTRKERKYGRQVSLSCSEPPEYSPDERVVTVEELKGKVIVVTEQLHGFKNQFRYILHSRGGEWKIDRKDRYSDFEGKWSKVNL